MNPELSLSRLLLASLAALIAGAVNAVAGGGTLLTFPALVAAGMSPLTANATSTVALLPGALASVAGYREALRGGRRWGWGLAIPSLVGGGIGAWLLLRTSNITFEHLVPWLVLGATALFAVQPALLRRLRGGDVSSGERALDSGIPAALLFLQLVVGVYGGYFGAGVGILSLAIFGFMGLSGMHRLNGLKSLVGFCMNLVAALTFLLSGIVDLPVAVVMAVGAAAGGYLGSRAAQHVAQEHLRYAVLVIGFVSGVWLLLRPR